MTKPYMSSVHETATAEYVIKKSRFISNLFHVTTEEEAQRRVAEMKKKYWDARHNCYAYRLGPVFSLQKASDDGEPSGTAGKPVLEVLKAWELTDTLIVVTRYFGGTKLGAGGLVRAYGTAATLGLEAARIDDYLLCDSVTLETEYSSVASVERAASECGAVITERVFTDKVILHVAIPTEETEKFRQDLVDVTNGKIGITGHGRKTVPRMRV